MNDSQVAYFMERKTQKQQLKDQFKKRFKWTLMKGSTKNSNHLLSFNPIKQELIGKMQLGPMQYYLKASEEKALLAAQYRF